MNASDDGQNETSIFIPTFAIGDRFSSFSQFEAKLNSRIELTNEKLRIGTGSVKVKASSGKIKLMKREEDIVYRYVIFTCKHGGTFKSKGKGQRKVS